MQLICVVSAHDCYGLAMHVVLVTVQAALQASEGHRRLTCISHYFPIRAAWQWVVDVGSTQPRKWWLRIGSICMRLGSTRGQADSAVWHCLSGVRFAWRTYMSCRTVHV
jgi:hypothetical protein